MKNLRALSILSPEAQSDFLLAFSSAGNAAYNSGYFVILSPPNRVSSSESPILSNSISVSTWSCIALLCTRGDWFTLSLELWVCSLSLDNGTIVLTTTRFYRHWCTLISVKIFHKPFLFNVQTTLLLLTEEEVDAVGISSPLPGLSWSSTRDSILLSVCELVDGLSSSTDVVLLLWKYTSNVWGDWEIVSCAQTQNS